MLLTNDKRPTFIMFFYKTIIIPKDVNSPKDYENKNSFHYSVIQILDVVQHVIVQNVTKIRIS